MQESISHRLNRPAAASIWYTASNIAAKGISLLLTPVFTRLLSPAEYGAYTLYTSWLGIFTVIGTLEICGAFIYSAFAKSGKRSCDLALSGVLLLFLLNLSLFILYSIFKSRFDGFSGLGGLLTCMLILQVFFDSILNIFSALKRYSYNYKAVCAVNIASGAMTPLLSLALISLLGLRGASRIFASFSVSVLFAAIAFSQMLKGRMRETSPRTRLRDILLLLRGTLPTLPHYISLSVIAHSDKLILSSLSSDGSVGKYGVAYSVGFIFSLVGAGISSALSPWLVRRIKNGEESRAAALLSALLLPLSLLGVIFMGVVPEVFGIIAGGEYMSAIPAVYPTVVGVIFLFLCGTLRCAVSMRRASAATLLIPIGSAATAVLLCFILIPQYGYFGAAFSPAAAYVLMALGYELSYHRSSVAHLIDVNKSLLCLLMLSAGGFIMYAFAEVILSRLLLLSALLLLLLPTLNKIKGLVFEK